MFRAILLLTLLFAVGPACSQEVPLWPEGAPGALGTAPNDTPALKVFPAPQETSEPLAAVLLIPGGGYKHLSGFQEYRDFFQPLPVRFFSLKYRLPVHGYLHPAPLEDARRAVRLIRANANTWNIDPDRLLIVAFSSGGHVATTLATHDAPGRPDAADPVDRMNCRPDFMALFCPVISMKNHAHGPSVARLLGPSPDAQLLDELSNELQVTKRTPPTFLAHASDDKLVPPENSKSYHAALKEAGVATTLKLYPTGGHNVTSPPNPWREDLANWLRENGIVSDAKASPPEAAPSPGPFLANGSRNGWATQNSIVIWTRTTRAAEMNSDGPRFVDLSAKEAATLARERDPEKLLAAQLPAGASLDEMFGACPGAPGRVRLSFFPEGFPERIQHTDWKTTTAMADYTAQWTLEGLTPATRYVTEIHAQTTDGHPSAVHHGEFKTAPSEEQAVPLSFCVTTCHDFVRRDDGPRGHKIYTAMTKLAPDFVVHAGDIEYYDTADPWALTKELMRFKWGRIFALPMNRAFYSQTTSYFIKDDHDTLANDCWPGKTYGAVSFAEGVKLFNEEQFPSHDPRYDHIRWGRDLEIWLLEGRDFRSPNNAPDGPEKTILGAKQKAWLLETLERSDARFKLVFSPTPIVGPDRVAKGDNHANEVFAWEGDELRRRLGAIPGVIVFCGDRHWQYASAENRTGLWEFGCGPGSEKHQLGWKPGDERPEHRFLRVAGGFLSANLDYPIPDEPTLTISHRDVTGNEKSRFVFPMAK